MNFYKRYLGDYVRDTAHLSLIEHGAYTVLLDTYYATEKGLPADKASLYRIAKAFTAVERKAVDRISEEFFPVNGDGTRHNARADREMGKRADQVETNRRIAEERERKRKEHESSTNRFDDRDTNGSTNDEPNQSHSHSQNQKDQNLTSSDEEVAKPAVPPCPHVEIIGLYHELLPMGRQVNVELWNGSREASLKARWREAARRQNLDWWKRFFSYIAQSEFLTGRTNPVQGRKPFEISLDWILKPTNFAKIIEGAYNG